VAGGAEGGVRSILKRCDALLDVEADLLVAPRPVVPDALSADDDIAVVGAVGGVGPGVDALRLENPRLEADQGAPRVPGVVVSGLVAVGAAGDVQLVEGAGQV